MDGGTANGNYAGFADGQIPSRAPEKKRRGWLWPVVLGLFALLAIAGAAVYFSLPKGSSGDSATPTASGSEADSTTSTRSAPGVEATTESDGATTPAGGDSAPSATGTSAATASDATAASATAPTDAATAPAAAPAAATTAGVLLDAGGPDAALAPEAAAANATAAGAPGAAPLVAPVVPPADAFAMSPTGFVEEELDAEKGFMGLPMDINGKYRICIGTYGEEYIKNDKPCGVQVNADGTIVLGEYFGGFDGFFSTDPADGHENCFNTAVVDAFGLLKCETEEVEKTVWEDYTQSEEERLYTECDMIKGDKSACACCAENGVYAVVPWQRGWTGNKGVKKFLQVLRDTAAPVDFNYELEEDKIAANGGGRLANKALVEEVFASMVVVDDCSNDPAPEFEVDAAAPGSARDRAERGL